MKTITCKMMNLNNGGCDHAMTVSTYEEIMTEGMKHMEEAHPEQAEKIKSTPKDDKTMLDWEIEFKKIWEDTPNL